MKWFSSIIILLTLFSKVYGQESSLIKIEQIALDYVLNELTVKDSRFTKLNLLATENTSGKKTSYRSVCRCFNMNILRDSSVIRTLSEEDTQYYYDTLKLEPLVSLKVNDNNLLPNKIKPKHLKTKNYLLVSELNHKIEFKDFYFVSIYTRYLNMEKGMRITLKISTDGTVVDYCIIHWIA